jgi:hypothetical protein
MAVVIESRNTALTECGCRGRVRRCHRNGGTGLTAVPAGRIDEPRHVVARPGIREGNEQLIGKVALGQNVERVSEQVALRQERAGEIERIARCGEGGENRSKRLARRALDLRHVETMGLGQIGR